MLSSTLIGLAIELRSSLMTAGKVILAVFSVESAILLQIVRHILLS